MGPHWNVTRWDKQDTNSLQEAISHYIDLENKRVVHLSYFQFDVDRIKELLRDDSLQGMQRVMVADCLSLEEMDSAIEKITNGAKDDPVAVVVVQDLDEAFNVSSFKDYSKGTCYTSIKAQKDILTYLAGVTITRMLRNLRKMGHRYNTTCLLTQCGTQPTYSVRYVDKLVRETCDG